MRDAVIVDALRTPIAKRNGVLAGTHPADLSALVLQGLIDRSGLDPALVDDVIWGCVTQVGEQSFNVARTAVLSAGWPESVPGTTVDRQCGSSQQAIAFAAAGVISGQYDIAVAGGVESMSRVPMGAAMATPTGSRSSGGPLGSRYRARYGNDLPNQAAGAEAIIESERMSRADLDELALRSHERAAAAADAGLFDGQILPVTTGEGARITADEGIRRDTSLERLSQIRPAFTDGGKVTAGNSSQISDGAAALLIMTSERARALGLRPIARIHTSVVAGVAPMPMLTGPVAATRKALAKARVDIQSIGAFEINEAFACVPLQWQRTFDIDPRVVNPRGGAIALGHPLGATGARLMTALVHHMRDAQIRFGLQSICEGGGQANATLLELVA